MGTERKKTEWTVAWGLLVLGGLLPVCAQRPGVPARATAAAPFLISSSGPVATGSRRPNEIMREIDDPHTGARWLLLRNEEHPGGPGRLVLAEAYASGSGAARRIAVAEVRLHPVIRAGDRLVVEEHTARVDAVLEARALGAAAAGEAFDARLTIGGLVERVVALGPGRAALQPETGVQP